MSLEGLLPLAFAGRRVLVVEDEVLVAMMLEDILVDRFGCVIAAHVTRVDEGLQAARSLDIDVAFLDLNLRGLSSLPIAEVLRGRGVPVVLTSGYDEPLLPAGLDHYEVIAKPYTADDIGAALGRTVHGEAAV